MHKPGRNDPCPCGSGKKYKHCCGRASAQETSSTPREVVDSAIPSLDLVDLEPLGLTNLQEGILPDPISIERSMKVIERILEEHDFDSFEEAHAYLQGLLQSGEFPSYEPETELEKAQEIIYEAMEATGAQRLRLAKQALAVSEDCADAYVLIAEETAKTAEEALPLLEQAVAAGERALGPETFEYETGYFWDLVETRPYMQARLNLALCLFTVGEEEQAMEHYREILRLNLDDDQGVRYLLLPELLRSGKRQQARSLLDTYREEISAVWAYGRTLLSFQEKGAKPRTRHLLDKAISVNPYVPSYMLGQSPMPDEPPLYLGLGDQSEAIYCVKNQIEAWKATEGALEWLAQVTMDQPNRMIHDLEAGHGHRAH